MSNDAKSYIFIDYSTFLVQWKTFESKTSLEFRKQAKLPKFCHFSFLRRNGSFHKKSQKLTNFARFLNSDEFFDSNLFYWTRNTLYFMKTYDFSSLLLIAAHYCSFSRFFLSSQHNFTCPGGKKKFSILLLPRNKVRHGLDWWCTCIRKAFKPKILGQGVFGNDWEKLKIQNFHFYAIFTCTGEKKFLYSFFAPSQKFQAVWFGDIHA